MHFVLHNLICAGVEGTVISKQELSDDSLLHLWNSLQAPKVEQPAISPVSDRYSNLAVMEGTSHHGGEYCTEERRSENAALFHAVHHWKASEWSQSSGTLTIMQS